MLPAATKLLLSILIGAINEQLEPIKTLLPIKVLFFFIIFLFIFFISPISYGIDSYVQKDKRTDFPGKEIAFKVQKIWDKNFSNNISIVAGKSWVYGGWYAGNLSYHLKSRPTWEGFINDEIFSIANEYLCIDDVCVGTYK